MTAKDARRMGGTLPAVGGDGSSAGWSEPRPAIVPRPTYWPAVLAASVTFALWGVLTSVWIVVVGAAGALLAAGAWFAEVQHDESE